MILFGAGATPKKITLANFEAQLWTDFVTYVDGLTDVITATDTDELWVDQGGTPKALPLSVLKTYMGISGFGDVSGPVATTADKVPQWDSTTKLLKDGLTVATTFDTAAPVDTKLVTEQAIWELVVDEDTMVSDSAVLIPTQQSVKAYADSLVAAGTLAITALDIDGGTDIGAALVDADLLIVDDGAGGTNRKTAMSRVKTYAQGIKLDDFTAPDDTTDLDATASLHGLMSKAYASQLDAMSDLATTAGSGMTAAAASLVSSVEKIGSCYKTTIAIDLAGVRATAAGDIIGLDGTTNPCHIGQITAAKNGTIFAGKITCLETPAGPGDDIDLYSATESTGSEDDAIAGLTETQLINAGSHAVNAFKSLTAFPAANEYLYLVAQVASDADYTAGILLIELWGK